MEDKKKKQHKPSPAVVVSTGCSNLRSCISLCRPFSHPQPSLPPENSPPGIPLQQPPAESTSTPLLPSFFSNGEAAAQAYWKRCKQLEQELRQLDKWLNAERKMAEECFNFKNTTPAGEQTRDTELMRLADGSYLREVKKVGRPWGRLVMHLSAPTIAENTSSAIGALSQMTSMKPGDLYKCLNDSMPMADISGQGSGQIKAKLVLPGSGAGGSTEMMLLRAAEKMETLVLEGLRIQMGTNGGAAAEMLDKKDEEKSKDKCAVMVMMIQVRDPKENYEAVGDPMIGLVEATAGEVAGRRCYVHGVHVAGMKSRTKLADGKDFMWSASLKGGCKASCCWHYVRNPDRPFFFMNE